jgi:uncharacterized protein involved in tellurium resistance
MFAVQEACKWGHKCIIDKLSNDTSIKKRYPYIKLRGGDRDFDLKRYFS